MRPRHDCPLLGLFGLLFGLLFAGACGTSGTADPAAPPRAAAPQAPETGSASSASAGRRDCRPHEAAYAVASCCSDVTPVYVFDGTSCVSRFQQCGCTCKGRDCYAPVLKTEAECRDAYAHCRK